jgi:alkylhydroperoxidase family enzyme
MRDALGALIPPVQRHPRPPTEDRPRGQGTLGLFAHHPELAKAFFTFNGHILWQTSLTARQREIVVLRVAVVRRSVYLWTQHIFEGRDAGLTAEEIDAMAEGAGAYGPLETAIVKAVDELVADSAIAEDTWSTLADELDEQQLLDLIFTAGCYDVATWMYNSVGLVPDPEGPAMYARYQAPPEQ